MRHEQTKELSKEKNALVDKFLSVSWGTNNKTWP